MLSIDYYPKRTKYCKEHRGRMTGSSQRGNNICFGKYAIKSIESSWISSKQIEAGRKVISQYIRNDGKIWIRIFPDKPITLKPTGTRMGSGKGSTEYWVSVVKTNKIIYEFKGISETKAKLIMKIVMCKIPIKTKFIILNK
uniref:50S ribosomal protein L16, chloroplastic n=1 Tax=Epipogium aphyllum TaxID=449980 RepID=A0A0B4N4V1_9ASPA|nr:ribosomal protein L16 [Epipogium aphyllum]AII40879.1 ribosomal protein L16 [Epipogium aphyllum]AIS35841.1 ribosomal protein L16 [Epipogium aphyllum]